jgi:C-terminal processing protease CtpA/Prc
LQKLRYAVRESSINVTPQYPSFQVPVFKPVAAPDNAGDDLGYRLLALFNFWNIMEYFSPYKDINDTPWGDVLERQIPLFVNADSSTYRSALDRLISEFNDSHMGIFQQENKDNIYNMPFECQAINGELIVCQKHWESTGGLKVGDRVVAIDSVDLDKIIEKNRIKIAASNNDAFMRDCATIITLTYGKSTRVTFERDGVIRDTIVTIRTDFTPKEPNKSVFKMLNDSIGYLYPEIYENVDLDALYDDIFATKALIIDMRCYPMLFSNNEMGFGLLDTLFLRNKVSTSITTLSSLQLPGMFFVTTDMSGYDNPDAYKGKIILLVNANTQSMAEWTAMIIQSQPNVTTIGSQTAGADGNVATIYFPGGYATWFSAIGVFYPDGDQTQRIGIRIDEEVRPTRTGIIQGRDEVLERAIEIIKENMK